MLRAIASADGEPINDSAHAGKKKWESWQEPNFLLLESKTVSGSLETNFSGKIT